MSDIEGVSGIHSSARGIFEGVQQRDQLSEDEIVNDGRDIVIDFELFHSTHGKLVLSFSCL